MGDINIAALIDFHKSSGRLATLTGVQPPGRFGAIDLDEDKVLSFEEKPQGDGAWINGGFFVLSSSVIELIPSDATVWEKGPLEYLAKKGELGIYKHQGFWRPMDTQRDRVELENLWDQQSAPWKTW